MENFFQESPYKSYYKIFVDSRKTLHEHWRQVTGTSYPPSVFFHDRKSIQLCLTHSRFRANLDKAFPPLDPFAKESRQLEKELKDQFWEIKELSQYRKILFTPWESEETKVAIMGDETTTIPGNTKGICVGMVVLDPLEELEVPAIITHNERVYISFRNRDGVINFLINRHTGELCYFHNSSFCINDVIPPEYYLAIKKRVYEILLDYLRKKEPDIDDLFAKYVPPPKPPVIAEIEERVADVLIPQEEKALQEATDIIASKIIDVAPEVLSDEDDQVALESQSSPHLESQTKSIESGEEIRSQVIPSREKKNEYLRRLKGLKGQKALAALKRLLGDPIRIQGSHYLFKSSRNNKVFPFPIHMSSDMSFFILSANLQGMGYGLDEFCEEL